MKICSILLFVFLLSFIGCTPSKFIADTDKEQIFSHELNSPKVKIKERLVTFVNEKYTSSKAVLQSNEDGLLSGNGIAQATTYMGIPINMEFTFIVKYSDNRYKVKWIIKDLMMNSKSINQNLWGYYLDAEEITLFFQKNDKDIFTYLSSNNLDF